MLFGLLLVTGIGYLAYKSRPSPKAFPDYYESNFTQGKKSFSGIFERLIGGRQNYHFSFIGLFLAWVAIVEDTKQIFVGLFGIWIPIVTDPKTSEKLEDSIEMGRLNSKEEKFLSIQKEGHSLKAEGKYMEASKVYVRAANSVPSDDPFSNAELLDEAARCRKMAGDTKGYFELSNQAAEMYKKKNRSIRAAGIYERLGKHLSSSDATLAIKYFEKAIEMFQVEEDGRAKLLFVEVLNLKASIGDFKCAAEGFLEEAKRLIETESHMIYQAQKMLLYSLVCWLGTRDLVLFNRKCDEFSNHFPWFRGCRECKFVCLLSDAIMRSKLRDFDADTEIENLEEQFKVMATMPNWFQNIWVYVKEALIQSQPDLT